MKIKSRKKANKKHAEEINTRNKQKKRNTLKQKSSHKLEEKFCKSKQAANHEVRLQKKVNHLILARFRFNAHYDLSQVFQLMRLYGCNLISWRTRHGDVRP